VADQPKVSTGPNGPAAVAVIATIGAAAATHHSRWYLTPSFTTFLVFLLMLYAVPKKRDRASASASSRR
jgi:hypothetical protein